MKFVSLILAVSLLVYANAAYASKRLGGGKAVGKQSTQVAQKEAGPGAAQSPTQNGSQSASQTANNAATAPKPAGTPPVAAQTPKRPWGSMLGSLAAGLGLAWLAHSLGLGEDFGQFIFIAGLVLLAMLALSWFMRWRAARAAIPGRSIAFQGDQPGGGTRGVGDSYRVENVGNDASARPFERKSYFQELKSNPGAPMVNIGSGLRGAVGWGIPKDFDTSGFLGTAKVNFVCLQAAWDRSDLTALRAMMTDPMLNEIKAQLDDRESHTGAGGNVTEVVTLDAQLLGIEDVGDDYMASVEFTGVIREDASAGPNPFREVWNMTKPKSGNHGWLVAGVQALA